MYLEHAYSSCSDAYKGKIRRDVNIKSVFLSYPDENSASPDGQDDEAYGGILRKSIMPLFPFIAIPAHFSNRQAVC